MMIRQAILIALSSWLGLSQERAIPFRPQIQIGFDQTGAAHVTGPNGLDLWGAYHFQDLCTPLRDGSTCYVITFVSAKPVSGLAPDIWTSDAVEVWGDPAGHFYWKCGDWQVEMIAINETIRQQVSWEAEKMGWKHASSGTQTVNITIGRDTLTFTGRK